MQKTQETTKKKQQRISRKITPDSAEDILHHLAFENTFQANIIFTVRNGKIISANSAACKLLGYSKTELLTKSKNTVFDIKENSFKKMISQRRAEGHSTGLITVIKKSGKKVPCEITSALFFDESGIEKSITTIADMRETIHNQKTIDSLKEKVVAENIVIAKSKQKNIECQVDYR